jgi:hypothetical protein
MATQKQPFPYSPLHEAHEPSAIPSIFVEDQPSNARPVSLMPFERFQNFRLDTALRILFYGF